MQVSGKDIHKWTGWRCGGDRSKKLVLGLHRHRREPNIRIYRACQHEDRAKLVFMPRIDCAGHALMSVVRIVYMNAVDFVDT